MKLSLEEKELIRIALHDTFVMYIEAQLHNELNKKQQEIMEKFGRILYRFENNGERPPKS